MSNRIVSELKKLAEKHGGFLTADEVVDAARPKTSPLHSRFQWDNTKAAEEYRRWQARHLLRVLVSCEIKDEEPVNVFVSLSPDRKKGGGGYRTLTSVLSDEEYRVQLLIDALSELELFRKKYIRLKELAEIFSAEKRIRKRVKTRG